MKQIPKQPAQLFAGHAYTVESSDQLGTFQPAWQDFEAQLGFKTLDDLAEIPNRSAMVVFSPYDTFLYWIGSLLPADAAVPKPYEAFRLPEATAGQVRQPATSVLLKQLPMQQALIRVCKSLKRQGILCQKDSGKQIILIILKAI